MQNNIIDVATDTYPNDPHRATQIHTAQAFPHLEYMGQLVPFAFMSIVGNTDDAHLYTKPGNHLVTVGTAPVTILVVYAPPGGISAGDGTPGIWVDAFNVTTGQFSDAPAFVQVFTPPDSLDTAGTNEANVEGDISTVIAKNMRADLSIEGILFLKWKKITPVEAIVGSRDVSLTQNETGEIWFAFYEAFRNVQVPSSVPAGNWIELTQGVMVHVGSLYIGPGVIPQPVPWPVDSLSTLPAKLLSTLAILSLSSNMSKEVKAEAINLAVKHLYSLAGYIKENGDKIMQ
jgi:hypothetical protein